MEREKVYEEWGHRLIPAPAHGPGVHYRVFVGTVNWKGDADDLRRSFVVFMQYGDLEDWKEACRAGQIAFHMPIHITSMTDMVAISDAVDALYEKHVKH